MTQSPIKLELLSITRDHAGSYFDVVGRVTNSQKQARQRHRFSTRSISEFARDLAELCSHRVRDGKQPPQRDGAENLATALLDSLIATVSSAHTLDMTPATQMNAASLLTWLWRVTGSHNFKGLKDASKGSRELLSEHLSEILSNPAINLQPSSSGFIVRAGQGDHTALRMVLPTESAAFTAAFRFWWRARPHEMLTLMEELWKYLHPDNRLLTPAQKTVLARCFVTTLRREEFAALRHGTEVSWHFAYWHKLRWQAAQCLHEGRELEEAALEWMGLCYGQGSQEEAISDEIDPEVEIRVVLHGGESGNSGDAKAKCIWRRLQVHSDRLWGVPLVRECLAPMHGIPTYIVRRDRTHDTLFKLAAWFSRRYDLTASLEAVGLSYIFVLGLVALPLVVAITNEFAVGPWHYALPAGIGLWVAAWALCALVSGQLDQAVRRIPRALSRGIRLQMRVLAALMIGWVAVLTDDFSKFAKTLSDWNVIIVAVVGYFLFSLYVVAETGRYLPRPTRRFGRCLRLVLLLAAYSLSFGVVLAWFGHPNVLGDDVSHTTISFSNCPLRTPYFWLASSAALSLGVLLQALWEEKPLTASL